MYNNDDKVTMAMMIRQNWFQHSHVSHRGEIHENKQFKKMSKSNAYAQA